MIEITESAKNKIKKLLQERQKGKGIKIDLVTTGCSGLAYKLEYVDEESPNDYTIDCESYKIYVDLKSLPILNGSVIDYVKNGLNEGFEFNNPNESNRCGCGKSFTV